MAREVWVYPEKGEPYRKGTREQGAGGVAFVPDQEDFVSPLDGKRYSGKAGMREHNAIHDVVSNRDLVGLPTLQSNSDQRSLQEQRQDSAARKERIIHEVNRHYK